MKRHKTLTKQNRMLLAFFVIVLAAVGTAALLFTKAATPFYSLQPEAGTVSAPARVVADTSATGNPAQAVQFKAPTNNGAGICNSPIGSVTDRNFISIGNTPFQVRNEAWGIIAPGTQTTYACNEQSWYTIANITNNGGAVQTYPDSLYSISGNKTIAQYTSITSTFGEAHQKIGDWNAGYDIWMNNWDSAKEVMIWNEWNGTPSYWRTQATTAVTLGGVPYHFVIIHPGEFVFLRDTQVKSGSVDILAALKWLVQQGHFSNNDVPTQIEYGVEICGTVGSQRFDTTAFTVNLN